MGRTEGVEKERGERRGRERGKGGREGVVK